MAPNQVLEAVELSALSTLYHATLGSTRWHSKSGWMSGDPCTSTWYGIDCDDGSVKRIGLNGNTLSGTMPTELGLLSHLSASLPIKSSGWCDAFCSNELMGTIPVRI